MAWLTRTLRRPIFALAMAPLSLTAWLLVKICAPRRAYRGAVRFVTMLYPLVATTYARLHPQGLQRDRRGIMLQWMFGVMTRHGFVDLDVRVDDLAAIKRRHAEGRGVMLCTAHTGLTMAMFSVLEQQGWRNVLITRGSGHGWNWGCRNPIQLIRPGGDSLLQLRRCLRQGAVAVLYPDTLPSREGPQTIVISPNLFEFARMTGTPLLYYDARLAADGAIALDVVEPVTGRVEEFAGFVAGRNGWQTAIGRAPKTTG